MNTTIGADAPNESTLMALLAIIAAFGMALLVIAIVWYFFAAFGYYKLAKNRDLKYPWIAWIPVCQNYLLGDLIGNEVWGFGYADWILLCGSVGVSLISTYVSNNPDINSFLALFLLIVVLVFAVYSLTALYKLYKLYSTKATLMLVLSIIFPFLQPIFIFAIRNNKPLEPVSGGMIK